MENVILTIHLILALLLIGVVLLQRSEGGGLGMGGGANGAVSARGAATALTKLTWIFAIAFIITSMTLTVLAARGGSNSSVVDAVAGDAAATEPAAEEAPANPALSGDLTAPGAEDAPEAPPPAPAPADGTAPATNP
jgi:preprotein translocase subunit SecG